MRLRRRQLLLGLAGAAGAAGGGLRLLRGRARAEPALESDHLQILSAAADRVMPGASQAGFEQYCRLWLLREPFSRAADWRPLLVAGAVRLNRLSRQQYQKDFAGLAGEQQDELLDQFQRGKASGRKFRSDIFFQRLVMLALECFFGDPAYGGNREQVGWRFAGYRACWWAPRRPAAR